MMKTIIIPDEGSFELPSEFQELSRVHLIMPYSSRIFYKKSIQVYFRNPKKDQPYCQNGFVLINGIKYMTVDNNGKQIFWETDLIDKYGNPKDERKSRIVPENQTTLLNFNREVSK